MNPTNRDVQKIETDIASYDHSTFEQEWIERIRTGDADAYDCLFIKYCKPLINFAQRYVDNLAVAEDCVQDVFVSIWINRNRLEPSMNIRSYLYKAVRNRALKYLDHASVVRSNEQYLIPLIIPVEPPDQELSQKEITESIQRAIEELPEKQHQIFAMNRYDGQSYSEIACILDISIKTVETQMGYALRFLRKRLSPFMALLLISIL